MEEDSVLIFCIKLKNTIDYRVSVQRLTLRHLNLFKKKQL